MKQPKNFEELFKLVNPQDLLDVINFSGINDHRNVEHRKIRRELQNKVFNSLNYRRKIIFDYAKEKSYNPQNPHNLTTVMEPIHYEIIVESLQDFYFWSHQFNHPFAHIYQRVQNALNIPLEDISVIMERVKDE